MSRPDRSAVAAAFVLAALVTAGRARAGDVNEETVVVELGPHVLTAADLLAHTDRLALDHPEGDPLADRKRLIEPIVEARLLVIEARARGYEDAQLRRQLDRLERDRLVAALEEVEIRDKIVLDEAAVTAAVARRAQVLHLHHLATATRPAADSLLARIGAGEDFAALARTHSIDPQTAATGGRLDPVTWGILPPVFEEVAYTLTPGAIGGPFAHAERWHLVRLDSITPDPAPRDSLAALVRRTFTDALFSRGQITFLAAMKDSLHYAVDDEGVLAFLARMEAWIEAGAPDSAMTSATDRFGFAARERALSVFTYDGGQFTIGDYADYMAGEPRETVRLRAERARVDKDLDQYFRHHAYSDLARARGYLELTGFARERERMRERVLIQRMYQAEVALPAPPDTTALRAWHTAHPGRYAGSRGDPLPLALVAAAVRRDLIAAREEERYSALITRLKERYPVVYHDQALLRLPL